jgi:hypothetical protein
MFSEPHIMDRLLDLCDWCSGTLLFKCYLRAFIRDLGNNDETKYQSSTIRKQQALQQRWPS